MEWYFKIRQFLYTLQRMMNLVFCKIFSPIQSPFPRQIIEILRKFLIINCYEFLVDFLDWMEGRTNKIKCVCLYVWGWVKAEYDAFRPCWRASSGSFDFVIIQRFKGISNKLHNLQSFRRLTIAIVDIWDRASLNKIRWYEKVEDKFKNYLFSFHLSIE
jgi:hypothetical protein